MQCRAADADPRIVIAERDRVAARRQSLVGPEQLLLRDLIGREIAGGVPPRPRFEGDDRKPRLREPREQRRTARARADDDGVDVVVFLLTGGLAATARAQNLSALAGLPDYRRLDPYQETITREEFAGLLERLYAPHGGWQEFIRLDPVGAVIRKTSVPLDDLYTLRFAPSEAARKPLPPEYWRARAALPPAARPLDGVKIALDPGHLGGRWAKLEERWFQIGDQPPVMEGEMTLHVARLLADRLRAQGAIVTLVRDGDEPTTPLRPADLADTAARQLAEQGIEHPRPAFDGPADPQRQFSIPWTSDVLFTRADIRARGLRVNDTIRPDLVVCLHFNAEAWGDPAKPALVEKNHLHLLVNGCYGPDEIAKDDVRFEMLLKLLDRSGAEEAAVAASVAPALAAATGLPPYQYTGTNAVRIGDNPYIWARNLLANRLYECPVVYIEPYVMNSPEVFARVQAGDYEGTREFGGMQRASIFREYADAVAAGLRAYYEGRGRGR